MRESRFAALLDFLRFFANPLVVILLVASAISLALGDPVGGLIIIAMVLLSVLLNFFMEFQARHAVEAIRKQVATTAAVLRDGREQELPVAELVPGDVVRLNAGDLVPADARLLDGEGPARARVGAHRRVPAGREDRATISRRASTRSATRSTASSSAPPSRPAWPRRVVVRTGRDTAFGAIAAAAGRRGRRRPSSAAASATSG